MGLDAKQSIDSFEICTAASTIAQLLVFNTVKRGRRDSIAVLHNSDRETALPLYRGVLIHNRTRKRDLIDILFEKGLSVSYDRVLQLSTEQANGAIDMYENEGSVCPSTIDRYENEGSVCPSTIDMYENEGSVCPSTIDRYENEGSVCPSTIDRYENEGSVCPSTIDRYENEGSVCPSTIDRYENEGSVCPSTIDRYENEGSVCPSTIDRYENEGSVCPSTVRAALFPTGNLDNIDHNSSSTSRQVVIVSMALQYQSHSIPQMVILVLLGTFRRVRKTDHNCSIDPMASYTTILYGSHTRCKHNNRFDLPCLLLSQHSVLRHT